MVSRVVNIAAKCCSLGRRRQNDLGSGGKVHGSLVLGLIVTIVVVVVAVVMMVVVVLMERIVMTKGLRNLNRRRGRLSTRGPLVHGC